MPKGMGYSKGVPNTKNGNHKEAFQRDNGNKDPGANYGSSEGRGKGGMKYPSTAKSPSGSSTVKKPMKGY